MAICDFLIRPSPVSAVMASLRKMLAFFWVTAHFGLARFGSGAAAPLWAMLGLRLHFLARRPGSFAGRFCACPGQRQSGNWFKHKNVCRNRSEFHFRSRKIRLYPV